MTKYKMIVPLFLLLISCTSNIIRKNDSNFPRNPDLIKTKMATNAVLLETIVNKDCSKLISGDTDSIQLRIAPSGATSITRIGKQGNLDTALRKHIDSALSVIIFDSIPQPVLFTNVYLKCIKNNDRYGLLDSIGIKPAEERSKASIMNVVMKNLPALRAAYNMRLREGMDKEGKITVKFAVDEFGTVLFIKIVSSTLNDTGIENDFKDLIKAWKFDKINNPGDVTEVVYPFYLAR